MTGRELSGQIASFIQEHGFKEASALLSRMLIGIAFNEDGDSIEFSDELGTVEVRATRIPDHLKN